MNAATFIFVIAAIYLAFRAGSSWRHNSRTWTDHRKAKADAKKFRELRWVTAKVAVVSAFVLAIYLIVMGAITLPISKSDKTVPASINQSTSPHATQSTGTHSQ
jgi:cell division septal protein FtsQ